MSDTNSVDSTPMRRLAKVLIGAIGIVVDYAIGCCVYYLITGIHDSEMYVLGVPVSLGVDFVILLMAMLVINLIEYIKYGTIDDDEIRRIKSNNQFCLGHNAEPFDEDLAWANKEIDAMLKHDEYTKL